MIAQGHAVQRVIGQARAEPGLLLHQGADGPAVTRCHERSGGGVVGDVADHTVHGHFRRPIGAVFRQGQGKLRRLPRGGVNAQAVVLRHLHRGAARAGIGPALFPGGHAVKAAVVPHAGAQAPHQGRDRQEHCGGQFDFPDDAFHDGFPHLSSEFPSAAAVVLCTVMSLYLCAIVNQKKRFSISCAPSFITFLPPSTEKLLSALPYFGGSAPAPAAARLLSFSALCGKMAKKSEKEMRT